MECDIPAGVQVANGGDAGSELGEITPVIAVVRPETGQIDVADEGDTVWFDQERTVAASVTGEVHHLHPHAAQIEHVAVGEPLGVRGTDEVERLGDHRTERCVGVGRHAVHLHQAVQLAHATQVGVVCTDENGAQDAETGHVILVGMTDQGSVDGAMQFGAAVHRERRIDEHRAHRATHEHTVAVGVLTRRVTHDRGGVRCESQVRHAKLRLWPGW
jgi:hypothetical protein